MSRDAEFVRRGGLLVPAEVAGQVEGDPARQLRGRLAADRDLVSVQREDQWLRRAQRVDHRTAMADVVERAQAEKRARRERARDAAEAQKLGALYRRATRSGERARIRAEIQGSAEVRALRVSAVRRVTLLVGIPVLLAFAAWSTTGVQAGVVRLLGIEKWSPAWWAAWGVEPALITIVALIIIGRAVLRSSGGQTDWKADAAEWTALSMSLALNILGGWTGDLTSVLPHSIGPLGAAGTAFLIGVFDGYVSAAKPWEGAPRLTELTLLPPGHRAPDSGPSRIAEPIEGPDLSDNLSDNLSVTFQPAPASVEEDEEGLEDLELSVDLSDSVADTKPPARKRQPSSADKVIAAHTRTPGASDEALAARLNLSVRTVQRWRPKLADPAQQINGRTPELEEVNR